MSRTQSLGLAIAGVACCAGICRAQVFDCPPWNADIWWGYHRDAFLPRATVAPLPAAKRAEIAGALRAALHETPDRDLIATCAFALGRIGAEQLPFDLQAELLPLPAQADQEIAETSALALGIGGAAAAIAPLCALARDDAAGRKLCARDAVPERTRAFALYGLGFLARRLTTAAAQEAVLDVASGTLADAAATADLQVAAISALSLLAPSTGAPAWPQAAEAVRALEAFAERHDPALAKAQAHVPPAIARLVGTARAAHRSECEPAALVHRKQWLRMAGSLRDRPERDDYALQSALLALAATMADDEAERKSCADVLEATATDATDPPCRFFATLALGRCATPAARTRLIALLHDGPPQQRPWAALALGLCERGVRARDRAAVPDDATSKALVEAMTGRDAEIAAAAAVGAGLGDIDCAQSLRALLGNLHDELAASAVDALWLRRDRAAVPELRNVFASSVRRPDLHKQLAQALFALGDAEVSSRLVAVLDAGPSLATASAACVALGATRDPASVASLLARLHDAQATPLQRAFAAVSLGLIAAGEAGDWSAPLTHGTNWLAAVPTLTDRTDGVLDIL